MPVPTTVPSLTRLPPSLKVTAVPSGSDSAWQPLVSVASRAGAVRGVADVDVARGVGEDEVGGALGTRGVHHRAGVDRGGRGGRPLRGGLGGRCCHGGGAEQGARQHGEDGYGSAELELFIGLLQADRSPRVAGRGRESNERGPDRVTSGWSL